MSMSTALFVLIGIAACGLSGLVAISGVALLLATYHVALWARDTASSMAGGPDLTRSRGRGKRHEQGHGQKEGHEEEAKQGEQAISIVRSALVFPSEGPVLIRTPAVRGYWP